MSLKSFHTILTKKDFLLVGKQYPIFFKFLTNFILSFFVEILILLNFLKKLDLQPCQIPIFFFANCFHGNFSPGSIFLNGAISE